MLADLHDVPNDARLPRSAVDEIRALILLRLISLAKKEQDNNPQNPLTVIEREALGTFKRLVALRRPQTAQKAMDEYNRWKSNPCGYTVPRPTNPSVFDFSFEEYEPGPGCNLETAFSAGGPRPPTADQFTAYGAALDKQGLITSADILAAYLQTDKAIALSVGILSGVVAGSVAGIGALVSVATANAFAAIAGSAFHLQRGVDGDRRSWRGRCRHRRGSCAPHDRHHCGNGRRRSPAADHRRCRGPADAAGAPRQGQYASEYRGHVERAGADGRAIARRRRPDHS